MEHTKTKKGVCMIPFSYVKEESLFGIIGLFIYIMYVIYIFKDKSININHTYRISIFFAIAHTIIVLLLMIGLNCSLLVANEGWILPFLISFCIDFLRYKIKK